MRSASNLCFICNKTKMLIQRPYIFLKIDCRILREIKTVDENYSKITQRKYTQ